jgi:hypothetical protein
MWSDERLETMPTGTIDPQFDYVANAVSGSDKRWPTITAARANALAVQELLQKDLRKFMSADVDIVVFGSLARREWTSGSDVDWTMLIDGQANSEHKLAAREVDRTVANLNLNKPGAEGIFGSIAFGHDIIHHIGGQADSNRNMTQRVLLLLEAFPLQKEGAFERIVRQLLNRYLASDSNFHSKSDQDSRIPRFLLNDIVRYWRTMCVDFAYKDWEQGGKKWALRNVKLRMSRKLLFFAGLLMVFSCFKNGSLRRNGLNRVDYLLKLQAHLLNFVHSTPLNIISWALFDIGFTNACQDLLDIYETFLRLLNDETVRRELGGLSEEAVYDNPLFLQCRDLSHGLHSVLKRVCFEENSLLREFTAEYGVF